MALVDRVLAQVDRFAALGKTGHAFAYERSYCEQLGKRGHRPGAKSCLRAYNLYKKLHPECPYRDRVFEAGQLGPHGQILPKRTKVFWKEVRQKNRAELRAAKKGVRHAERVANKPRPVGPSKRAWLRSLTGGAPQPFPSPEEIATPEQAQSTIDAVLRIVGKPPGKPPPG
ncbi:MAG TPA: hypothetical protein VGM06_19605 [Polyangiaceae bacterium]